MLRPKKKGNNRSLSFWVSCLRDSQRGLLIPRCLAFRFNRAEKTSNGGRKSHWREEVKPRFRFIDTMSGVTQQDLRLRVDKYRRLRTSSPSFSTMVPARSTTAKTMTAQSSLLTDMVMFANAGSWCMNSSNCSVRETEERQQRERRRLKQRHKKRRKQRPDTRRREIGHAVFLARLRCSRWRLSIRIDDHYNE